MLGVGEVTTPLATTTQIRLKLSATFEQSSGPPATILMGDVLDQTGPAQRLSM
jgi:hypothetical protein